ncbi:MAG: hypothetical protein JKX71_03085 [Amylibacter sp.]|nr:hypothetical protein [Amylibacter sp.]
MKRRSFITATVLSATLAAFAGAPTASAHDADFYFIDLLRLQDGKTPADAAKYFELIEPVVAKHGLERALPSFNISQRMAGDLDVDMLNVWTVTDPKGTFDGIFTDDAYKVHIPLRNSIFDMPNSTMFVLTPNK